MQALLGTRTTGDLNLIAQILMLVALWIGFYFARTKQIPKHRNMQTTVVLANLFLIAFVMVTSFYSFVVAGGTTGGTVATLMMAHGLLGLIAELVGIYLILRMRTQLIPPRFRVRNFKLVMRSLITLWTLIVILGLGIYYFRYLASRTSAGGTTLARLRQDAGGIALHAEEMQAAAQRGNLETAKRHAEHVVNLIVGERGADYGDLDKDGFLEDPGDGTGAINYLQQVRDEYGSGNNGAQVSAIANQVRDQMLKIVAASKTIIQSSDLRTITPQVNEVATLSEQIGRGKEQSVPHIASVLQLNPTVPTVTAESVPNAPNTVTVDMKDFVYAPESLTVKKGTTVVFVNRDNAKHTVTEDGGKFNSEDILAGKSYTLTFDEPGTFPYFCKFHGDKGGVDMAGKIVVEP